MKRIEQSAHRWKKAYEKNGLIGLTDSRKTESGRPLKRELTQSEVIERQETKIKLLEGQVDLLKKLEVTERRLLNVSENLETNKIYHLITETIEHNQFKRMTKYFCDLLEVSRSGYYSYLKAYPGREQENKLNFTQGIDSKDLLTVTVLIPPVNMMFLNGYPFDSSLWKQVRYFFYWEIVLLTYELIALLPSPWGYFHYGWWNLGGFCSYNPYTISDFIIVFQEVYKNRGMTSMTFR